MKCPKCGFNSFEYYENCKKCSNDLTGYKQTYSITSLVLPAEAKERIAAEFRSAESDEDLAGDVTESHDDIFSFDVPEDAPSSSAQRSDDPFNFDEPSTDGTAGGGANQEDDVFANLLESTSQTDDSPFTAAAAPASAPRAPVAPKAPAAPATPGEFDLENFSWDDTPAVDAAGESKKTEDDFDSLFGDLEETGQK